MLKANGYKVVYKAEITENDFMITQERTDFALIEACALIRTTTLVCIVL